jgi:hypothetical protein
MIWAVRIFGALRRVPLQVWLALAIVAALVGGLFLIDQRGYRRAKDQEERARLERAIGNMWLVAQIEQTLAARLAAIDTQLAGTLQAIDTEGRTLVQPIIQRELARDPSLADAGRCLSPGLLEAVNRARGHAGAGDSTEAERAGAGHVPEPRAGL